MLSPSVLPRPLLRALIRFWARSKRARVCFDDDQIRITRDERSILLSSAHIAYSADMVRYFDSYWGAVCDSEGVVDYSGPALHQYRVSGLRFWLPSIAEEVEALEGYFHFGMPESGALVFDLGAHTGVTTYHLARLVGPAGRVIAFEPDPTTFALLKRNIDLHQLTNVVPVCAAVAAQSGRASFNAEGALGAALTRTLDRHGLSTMVEVECVSLIDAFGRFGVPTFVKMDIEGAELEVIGAARAALAEHRVRFAVDTNHRVRRSLTAGRLEAIFRQAGYVTESSDRYGFMTTWAHRR